LKIRTTVTALLATLALGATALAANVISAAMIPDGTYTAKVIKVVDAKHVTVTMQNGLETTLAAGRPTIDFSKLHANDSMKFSLANGEVLVYLDLSSH